MSKENCDHPRLDFDLLPQQFDDTNVRRISMRAFCRVCKEQVRFVGIDNGVSIDRPFVSVDAFTVHLPAVMGAADIERERARAH